LDRSLVEDNPIDAKVITAMLLKGSDSTFKVDHVSTLEAGFAVSAKPPPMWYCSTSPSPTAKACRPWKSC